MHNLNLLGMSIRLLNWFSYMLLLFRLLIFAWNRNLISIFYKLSLIYFQTKTIMKEWCISTIIVTNFLANFKNIKNYILCRYLFPKPSSVVIRPKFPFVYFAFYKWCVEIYWLPSAYSTSEVLNHPNSMLSMYSNYIFIWFESGSYYS